MKIVIGIDSGVETGFAVWNKAERCLLQVCSLKIHQAMDRVLETHRLNPGNLIVRVEDARKRKWFGNAGREQLQGAGSIKRDAVIWEDFLTDHKIPFEMIAPKNNKTKTDADYFKRITGWQARTNNHARDAAMLCFGM
jgi:hypothetical protein